ncbi:unnamed protein product [Calypogeia fissa]
MSWVSRRGWPLVLASRESKVPPMLGAREDAICAAADAPVEKEEDFRLGQKQLRGWAMLMFGLRFAWDTPSCQSTTTSS